MTVSHWRASTKLGTINCEIAVIGAGVVGISAALHLQAMGVDALLVERHSPGAGASSRNAGFLMRGAADNYALAAAQYGRPTAKLLWTWTEDNLRMLRERGVESLPSYARRPSCLLALEPAELEELRTSLAMLQQDGFAANWLDRYDDDAWRAGLALGGLINPDDAVVNPVDLLRLLVSQLKPRANGGTGLLEHQELFALDTSGPDILLRITDGVIRCKKVLLCLNAYTRLLIPGGGTLGIAGPGALIEPNRGQMLVLDAPGNTPRLDFAYYANRGSEYFRRADDTSVVVGGCRTYHAGLERTLDDQTTPTVQGAIESFATRIFGPGLRIKHRWAGIMGFTPDHLPVIGPIAPAGGVEPDERVWICGACTGHGMSMGHRSALAAARGIMGIASADENPFTTSRFENHGTPR